MTIKDVKEAYVGQYAKIEIYRHNECMANHEFHTDNLVYVNNYSEDMELEDDWSYELMDEDTYENSIDSNCEHIPFEDYLEGDNPKILCILVK